MKKRILDIPAKETNKAGFPPIESKTIVMLSTKTRSRLDDLQKGLDEQLSALRKQQEAIQNDFISRMTDVVAGFLDGSGVDFDLSVDTVMRSKDGLSLEVSYANPTRVDPMESILGDNPGEAENPDDKEKTK